MEQFLSGTNVVLTTSREEPALEINSFSPEDILPMALIREHTKTDDVPAVSDSILDIYRSSALAAAEAYTGLPLQAQRQVIEDITPREYREYGPRYFIHELTSPTAQPFIWYYGVKGRYPDKIHVAVGTREVKLPCGSCDFGLGCRNGSQNSGSTARLLYVSGFLDATQIPSAILLGALKYIAHAIENPGDIVKTVAASGQASTGLSVSESANPAWASGAVEIWRSVVKGAI